ncbi:hypothetical protein BDN70DRAFT_927142 [Pholiota conissans]|uniref:Uncharacterized protein n=1 Tax=Pholiota conissans TaxID=109636 RepID=A0A9P5ZEQ2_9AGAR|nr:hypothetical protein BDN70DRAFT_927142 [Pholiota conissans]
MRKKVTKPVSPSSSPVIPSTRKWSTGDVPPPFVIPPVPISGYVVPESRPTPNPLMSSVRNDGLARPRGSGAGRNRGRGRGRGRGGSASRSRQNRDVELGDTGIEEESEAVLTDSTNIAGPEETVLNDGVIFSLSKVTTM